MKIFTTIVLLGSTLLLHSQEISRSTQSSSGGSTKCDQGYTLEFTFGAQFSQISQADYHLTEGFQQGDLDREILPVEESGVAKRLQKTETDLSDNDQPWQVQAYPNPSQQQLYIDIIHQDFQGAEVRLFDLQGTKVATQIIPASISNSIEIQQFYSLTPGVYILYISMLDGTAQSITIIKSAP